MSKETHVDPAELRASAAVADALAEDLAGPAGKAVKEAATAGSSLAGWSFGAALSDVSSSWKPALDGLHARMKAGAANLRSSAQGHEWNDQRTSKDFENPGTGTGSATAHAVAGELPAVLRRPGGDSAPRYGSAPIGTWPTAGENPFG
ncbi:MULTISPECIES: type VII secretion target [unclassified Streptomyces]|uniref:type VII secretion target n=1 Tax=unclassified Streptomyces TaxID=2593676 RepID=UPI00278C86F6|nr:MULTISPECIES: type VII secretion target [unclassified Streptomyces]